jgi:hypothetical protein
MFANKATTVSEYLASLPPDRKKVVSDTRSLVRKHIPKGYLHFKTLDDIPVDAVASLIESHTPDQWIAIYEKSRKKS